MKATSYTFKLPSWRRLRALYKAGHDSPKMRVILDAKIKQYLRKHKDRAT